MGERAAVIIGGAKRKPWKAQAPVSEYHEWLIKNLVNVWGTNESDVVRSIITQWIVANKDELREMGLYPPKVRAGQAVVIPRGA